MKNFNLKRFLHLPISTLIATLTALTLAVLNAGTAANAQEERFIEGGHYELLDKVQPVQTGDKIEVVEMFWYQCPHCYRLEPYLIEWQKNIPENAAYVAIPAMLSARWEFDARAYFTFEALGLIEQLHTQFFNAIHLKRLNINSVQKLQQWVDDQAIGEHDIIGTFSSFAVENKLSFASLMSRNYGLTGVPAIIVDGRYRTSVSLAGGHNQLIEVINYLIEKVKADRAQ